MKIEDGTGVSFQAKVGSNNRLWTFSQSLPGGLFPALQGRLFGIIAGTTALTSANDSAFLYVRYTSDARQLVIPRLTYVFGTSTGGSESSCEVAIVQNASAGSIISNANQALVQNRNFAQKPSLLSGSKLQGVEGDTLTDGEEIARFKLPTGELSDRDLSQVPYVLGSGTSIGIKIKPPSGNTSMTARIFMAAYEIEVN